MTEHEYAQMIADLRAPPRPGELDNAPALDNWECVEFFSWFCLFGLISGHPKLKDGQLIHTSPLLVLSEDLTWARTRSRFYVLGPIDPSDQLIALAVRERLLMRTTMACDLSFLHWISQKWRLWPAVT